MVLFDKHGQIKRYTTPEEILLEFFELRMEYYIKRRAFLIQVHSSLTLRDFESIYVST
jgi:DNA topoisomerase-2